MRTEPPIPVPPGDAKLERYPQYRQELMRSDELTLLATHQESGRSGEAYSNAGEQGLRNTEVAIPRQARLSAFVVSP